MRDFELLYIVNFNWLPMFVDWLVGPLLSHRLISQQLLDGVP